MESLQKKFLYGLLFKSYKHIIQLKLHNVQHSCHAHVQFVEGFLCICDNGFRLTEKLYASMGNETLDSHLKGKHHTTRPSTQLPAKTFTPFLRKHVLTLLTKQMSCPGPVGGGSTSCSVQGCLFASPWREVLPGEDYGVFAMLWW